MGSSDDKAEPEVEPKVESQIESTGMPGTEGLPRGVLRPSAAYAMPARAVGGYVAAFGDPPAVGDVVLGQVQSIGAHRGLENPHGRIHELNEGLLAFFVYGNRYATDGFEALVPSGPTRSIDLVARSGVIAEVQSRNSRMLTPSRIAVLGHAVDRDGQPINTLDHPRLKPKQTVKVFPRSQMILVAGTSMNSGKSTVAAALCWSLTLMGHNVRASKITGTASLREIFRMADAGAKAVSDFSFLGYPSTHLLAENELLHIFDTLDLKIANNPKNYWIVEVADGLLQRETAILLTNELVRQRIHRLIVCASDSFGALGAIERLETHYDLRPDAISGLIANSPLGVRELTENAPVATFNPTRPDIRVVADVILG